MVQKERLPSLARRVMGERIEKVNVLLHTGHCVVCNPWKLQTSSLTRAATWCKQRMQSKQIRELKLCKLVVVSRLHELHTREGAVEPVVELKGLDNDTIQQHHTV